MKVREYDNLFYVIICEDDNIYSDYIKNLLLESGLKKENAVFYQFYSGEELIQNIEDIRACDLIYMDINMNIMNGYETVKHIRELYPDAVLVYCSGDSFPSVEAFKSKPFAFLLKTYSEQKMMEELKLVIAEMNKNRLEPYIVGHYYSSFQKIRPSEVLYIENVKHKRIVHLLPKYEIEAVGREITTTMRMEQIFEVFGQYGFAYCHHSYIVNLKYVEKFVTKNGIVLSNKKVLPLARSQQKTFKEILEKYWEENRNF